MQPVEIFDYLDFRNYLSDYYHSKKREDKKYSQRYFGMKLGMKSTGFLSDIIKGRRNLSPVNIIQFCKALDLNKEESNYFENLVNFNQAKAFVEKKHWLQRMLACKRVNTKILSRDEFEYFSKWYYSAIREMIFYRKISDNYKEIAAELVPSLKPAEVKEALELLRRLGIVEKNKDGCFVQRDSLISTGNQIRSVHVANFQLQTLQMAIAALDTMSQETRDFSTLTLSISGEGLNKIKSVLAESRREIMKIAKSDSKEDRVYQVNFQLFPLTRTGQSYLK
jgi:uncharacterized protein (TIGR02147 family)